jgi:hypothetical protein
VRWKVRKQLRVEKLFSNNEFMRIPKSLPVFCVVIMGAVGSLYGQRVDSDLQAKAREALREKMSELGNSPATTQPAPAAPVAPAATPAPSAPVANTPPPVPAAPPVTPSPEPAQTASAAPKKAMVITRNPDAQAKAEEALRRKMAELEQGSQASAPPAKVEPIVATAPTPAVPQPTPAPVAQPMPVAAQPPANPEPAPAMSAPAAPAPESAPMASTPAASEAAPTPAAPAATAEVPAKPVEVKAVTSTPAPAPEASPAPSASAISKEQRLADLLEQYKADKITPYQYHTERAKILAEP